VASRAEPRLATVDKLGHFHRCWCAIAAHENRLRNSEIRRAAYFGVGGFPASGFPTGFIVDSRTRAHRPCTAYAQGAKHPFLGELAGAVRRYLVNAFRFFAFRYSLIGRSGILLGVPGSSPITAPFLLHKHTSQQGPFPPPALPGFVVHLTLSDAQMVRHSCDCTFGDCDSPTIPASPLTQTTFLACRVTYPGGPAG